MTPRLDRKLHMLLNESFARRRFVVATFFTVLAASLLIGWRWPMSYTSSATIIVDDKNIIQPLMQGAAVATEVADRARLAREIIQSRRIMNQLIEAVGVAHAGMSPVERERAIEQLKRQTNIVNLGTNLIRVEFKDTDPERAYRANAKLVEFFIAENVGTKVKESESAFRFIDEQVRLYRAKLAKAEGNIKQFRAGANIPRGRNEANREDSLYTRAEQTRLELKEAEIRRATLERQLEGEARTASDTSQERELRARLQTLQTQLNNLRLTYQDTYPDIARLKGDIEQVKRAIGQEQKNRGGDGTVVLDEASATQLRQRLMQDLSQSQTQIAALRARLAETERTIQAGQEQGRRVTSGGVTLSDLMRDFEVNQSILDDLLKRREAARVSMNLDRDRQGLSFRIHDEASLPMQPSGPQFVHFAIAGLVLGLVLPFGLIYARQQLDARIRSHIVIPERLSLPLITVVPHLSGPEEKARSTRSLQWLAILVFSIVFIVISVIVTGGRA